MSDKQKTTIALTGATGFLGSHLMNALLRSGHQLIILGRSSQDEILQDRLWKLLKWFDATGYFSQLRIVEIDFSKDLLGLPATDYQNICEASDEIIHCASDTCFSESQRQRIIRFNVHLLSGILELARTAQVKSFSYISTAYAVGLNGQYCKEELSTARKFTNVYEESKALAEKTISDFCRHYSIALKIIRPTIVYGDSVTGRTLKFNAFYYPIRSLLFIRDIYLNDIQNNAGKKSSKHGIFVDESGFLFLPLRFYLPREGGINLIPVEYFVEATLKIIENSVKPGIFHLSNTVPSDLNQLSDFIASFLKIKGIQLIYGSPKGIFVQNPVEELFDRFIEPYRPYLSDDRIFERKNTNQVLGDLSVPEMSLEIFQCCMNYAIQSGWGEKFYNEENPS